MSLINPNFKTKFLSGKITRKEKIAEHTYHLQVQGDDIKSIDYISGQHMKVVVGLNRDAAQNDKVRSYSIWDYNKLNGTIDVAVCTLSGGLGAKWIENAQPNDDFYFFLKTTLTADNSADAYFFIGDISTLAHFYKVRKTLSSDKKVFSFIYGDNEADFFPDLDGSKPFNFYTLSSNKFSPAPIEFLQEKINSTMEGLSNNTIAYIGGDARVCAALTPYFIHKFNWKPEQIKMKSFWNPDKVREE